MNRKMICARLLNALAAMALFVCSIAVAGEGIDELLNLRKQFDGHYAAGRYREAEPLARKILALVEKLFPDQPEAAAIWLNNAAIVNDSLGRWDEAESLFKRALAINEKAYGREHLEVATNVNNLAELYRKQGRHAEAEPLYRRALSIGEKHLDPNDPSLATKVNNLALLYVAQARYREAEPLYQRALAIWEKAQGRDHPDVAICLSNLAELYDRQGRYPEAERVARRSLVIREKTLGNEHPDVISSLNNLACACENLGRYAEAESLKKRALTVAEKAFGPDHTSVANVLSNLALAYDNQGRFAEAEPLYRRALMIREKAVGTESADVALTLNNLACVFHGQGRYAEAEPLHKRALALREKILGDRHPDVAQSANNLATLYDDQRRWAEAEPLYQRALAVRRQALGPEHADVSVSLNNLAELYRQERRYDDASPLYEQALAIKKKALGPDHASVAVGLNNLALLHQDQGRADKAEPLYKQALAIREKALGPDHPDVAIGLNNLAFLYQQQGRNAEAKPLVDRAVSIRDRAQVAPGDRFGSYYLRARIGWGLGRKSDAVADLKRAMDLAEQQRGHTSGAERERAEYFARFSYAFECMVAWQAELGNPDEALAAMERGRARSLMDQLATRGIDLLAGVPAAEAGKLRDRERAAQARVTGLEKQLRMLDDRKDLSVGDRKQQREEFQERLREARVEYVNAYADVRNASPAYRLAVGQDRKPAPLEDVQKWVGDRNALLVEYLLGDEDGFVLIVPAGGRPRLEKLAVDPQQAKLLAIAPGPLTSQRMHDALVNDRQTGVLQRLRQPDKSALPGDAVQALAALWRLLIPEPERKAIVAQKFKRLIVIPDGPLAQLPFETLVVEPADKPRYLLDVDVPIEYAPSATILLNLGGRGSSRDRAGQQVLTVGDPRYGQPSARTRGDALAELAPQSRYASLGGSLTALPYSKWETDWVAGVFREKGTEVVQLRESQATEANVRAKAEGRKLLHLACHGLVDHAYGNFFGALALTPGPSADDPDDDGFLTLAEVYALDLRGTELAVLSACDTNYGPQQQGEGVWALSRGFLVAGARRVVASNWLVDDEAAASLISYFCGGLASAEKESEPTDYARALHNAQRWIRQQDKWSSPYYWGTFVLMGPN